MKLRATPGESGILKFVFSFARPFAGIYLSGLFIALVAAAIGYILPIAQKSFINILTSQNYSAPEVWRWFIFCGILMLGRNGIAIFQQFLIGSTSQKVIYQLKGKLLDRLLRLPAGLLAQLGGGYLSGRVGTDSEQLNMFFSNTLLNTIGNLLKLLGGVIFLFVIDWRAGLTVLAVLPFYGALVWAFRGKYFRLAGLLSESQAANYRNLSDSFNNIFLLKSHSAEAEAGDKLRSGIARETRFRIRKIEAGYRFLILSNLIPLCFQGTLITIGLWMILHHKWSIGELWALNCYLGYVFFPVRQICAYFMNIQTALAAGARLKELFEHTRENDDSGEKNFTLRGDIELENISFAYDEAHPVLQNFSWKINAGEKLTLSGESGSGKSTLLAIILGLYIPDSGKVRFDGKDLEYYNLGALRTKIGYLGADSSLVLGSLRYNLLLGNPEKISDDRIYEALKLAGVDTLVENLPDKLDTLVLEGGKNFSTGERLRLGLARELLRDVSILLLDEADTHLDRENALRFQQAVATSFAGKTVISVEHAPVSGGAKFGSDGSITLG